MLDHGLRPAAPMSLPDYYLRLTVGPYLRHHRAALRGFGPYWRRVLPLLTTMNNRQRIEMKLALMEAWIANFSTDHA
jgi:hypothetical protein